MQRYLTILLSTALVAPANAAVTIGALAVSATVAYRCSVIVSPRAVAPACQPGAGVAASHATRILRHDAKTGITTLTIEF